MKVLRHVKKGDLLVMNRQPSLHKPSMMGHRARILGQRALRLRMNYAPSKAYNADFDGDEMNGHLTQSYLAQCEVGEIANVGNNFLVPKDASPLLGLIQDHVDVVSGVLLTVRGRMLNKENFMHLVLAAFAETPQRLKIPPPCMIKPKMLWTGKQVRGFPTPTKDQIGMTESEVIFRAGELMCGVLDKSHYVAAQFGLVHCCFELYGHRIGIRILSCFSRLFTTYLQFHGFTLGVADILCLPEADKRRRQAIKGSRKFENKVVITTFGLDERASEAEIKHVLAATYCNPKGIGGDVAALDRGMKKALLPFNEEINKACVPDGLIRLFPQNGLQMMIESGAKGSTVNAMQISCALGQIELEGKRMATTIAGRTLPSFRAFDPSPRAGGYIDQRFSTGINLQELFFHTMAGGEGLIDTAVKTSRSGYLQRCIIKHLEGIRVHHDATYRDHDGSVIQFRYGEDGMDVCTSSFLEKKQFEFLRQNLKAVEEVSKPKALSDRNFNVSAAEEHYEKVKKYRRKLEKRGLHSKLKNAGFLAFSEQYTGAPKAEVVRLWQEMGEEDKKVYVKKVGLKQVDAVDERFNPWRTLGALPEKMLDDLDNYCRNLDEKAQKVLARSRGKNVPLRKHEIELQQAEKLKRILFWKGVHSLAAPGENVGLLAAQSIGEPSTQMTLNTFHFAGRGEMNVTLGIPRLREILMTAGKNISTPMAEIKLNPSASEADIERARKILEEFT